MKKIFQLIAILLIVNISSFGLVDILRQKLDSIFQYVDKSQIPTGYLKEYGSEFLPLHWFNGVLTDSNTVNSLDIFRTAYCDIITAKLPTPRIINHQLRVVSFNNLIPLPQVNDRLDSVANSAVSPIAILYTKYASLKATALADNLFTVSNQQIFDVPNLAESPYNTNNLLPLRWINGKFTNST